MRSLWSSLPPDFMRRVIPCKEEDAAASLDELWRRGIVRQCGPAAFDFTHHSRSRLRGHQPGPAITFSPASGRNARRLRRRRPGRDGVSFRSSGRCPAGDRAIIASRAKRRFVCAPIDAPYICSSYGAAVHRAAAQIRRFARGSLWTKRVCRLANGLRWAECPRGVQLLEITLSGGS